MARKRGKKKATGSIAAARRNALDSSANTPAPDDASNQPPTEESTPASTQDAVNEPIVRTETAEIAEIADAGPFLNVVEEELKRQSAAKTKRQSATKNKMPAAAKPPAKQTPPKTAVEAASSAEPEPKTAAEPELNAAAAELELKSAAEPESTTDVAESEPTATAEPESTADVAEPELKTTAEPESTADVAESELKSTAEPESTADVAEPELKSAAEPESTTDVAEPELKSAAEPESTTDVAEPELKSPAGPESTADVAEPELKSAAEPESTAGPAEPEPWRWSKPADYFAVSAVAGQINHQTPYKPVDYLAACAAPEPDSAQPEKTNTAPATAQPNPEQFWHSYESAAAARIQPDGKNKKPPALTPAPLFPHPNHNQPPASDVFLTFEEASKTRFPAPGPKQNEPPDINANPPAAKHNSGTVAKPHDTKNEAADDEGWIPADSKAKRPKVSEPKNFASRADQVVDNPSLAEQVMKLAASSDQTNMPVAEASDSGTNQTESFTSNDSSDSWQPISKLVDPKEIKAAPPVSERSKQFIDTLRQSITKSGARELTSPERDMDDRKASGKWRRSGEQHNNDDDEDDDDDDDDGDEDLAILQPPPGRQVLPPAPLRKQQTGEQKVTLEDRAIAENILPADFNEQQLSVKRLRDRTTTGKYHVYLAIYAICIVLGFATQRIASPEVLQVTKDAGQAVTSSISRLMLPSAISEFSNGLKTYEEETTRQMAARKPPVNFIAQISAGCDAAGKTAALDVGTAPVKQRRYWYSLPTGFVLGWPVAALYTVREIFSTVSNNKSGFELLLISLTCVAVLAYSAILYMKLTNRLSGVPKFAAPVIVGVLMSIVSIPIWAVLTFSLSICKVPMPDTIEVFTALAIIIVAGVSAKFSFVAPKKRHVDPRLM